MMRTGTRRARGAADAGSTTGVATAVLALLSASALATLGLVTASEISGGFAGGLGLGPGAPPAPPGKVVVAGGEQPGGGRGSGPGPGTGTGSGNGPQGPVAPTVVAPLTPDLTNELPTPSGVGTADPAPAAPVPAPDLVDPAVEVPPTEPAPVVVLPPPAEPGLRAVATRGRSDLAPGHTTSRRTQSKAADGRAAGNQPPAAPAVVPATTTKTDDRPAVVLAAAPAPAARVTGGRDAAPVRLAHAPRARGRGSHAKPAPVAMPSAPAPVVPTPAATALAGPPGGGPPAGDPPGLAKGHVDR